MRSSDWSSDVCSSDLVQADTAWASRLAALASIGRLAMWLLTAVLGVGLIAVTFNTIGLQVLTQREEIEVLRLLGATDSFIRRPFRSEERRVGQGWVSTCRSRWSPSP